MIHSKLKKGKTSQLLVEFSKNVQRWPLVVSKFYDTCKEENVKVNKTPSLEPEMMRFYTIEQNSQKFFDQNFSEYTLDLDKILKSKISQIELKFTVIYMNDQTFQIPDFSKFISTQIENPRVLLIRQTLEPFYHLNYEVENTLTEKQSMIYLCDLAATIINCKNEGQLQMYQQKKQVMIRKGNEGQLAPTQVIWRNALFQVPGLGKDKVKVIAQNFPTYKHIIKDCDKEKRLKNLMIGRGMKSSKMGSAIAERVYKVFGSWNGKQKLY